MFYFCIYNNNGSFEWDENKNKANIEKHGLDFQDAPEVFLKRHITMESTRSRAEQRYITIGVCGYSAVAVVYTKRGETIRIISFRRANRKERRHLLWLLLDTQ